jgi:hypothetical protein
MKTRVTPASAIDRSRRSSAAPSAHRQAGAYAFEVSVGIFMRACVAQVPHLNGEPLLDVTATGAGPLGFTTRIPMAWSPRSRRPVIC